MAKQITQITPEQEARFPEWVDKWIKHGLSCEPADFDRAVAAAKKGYRLAGLEQPEVVIRVSSPYAATVGGALAWMFLREVEDLTTKPGKTDKTSKTGKTAAKLDSLVGGPTEDGQGMVEKLSKALDKSQKSVGNALFQDIEVTGKPILNKLFFEVLTQIQDQIEPQTAETWTKVVKNVRAKLDTDLPKYAAEGRNNDMGGSLWVGFSAWVSFMRDVLGWDGDTLPKFEVYETLSLTCGWIWWHQNVCMISDRPLMINRDARGRLHADGKKAIEYRDGWGFHAWHGIRVPEIVAVHPEQITYGMIGKEDNTEIRRVMIERMGYDKYLEEAHLQVIDSCDANHPTVGLRTARLLRDDNNIVLLDMLNSTPEPDGTVKRYILGIDPDAYSGRAGRECLAAMASTWRNEDDNSLVFENPEDYVLMAES